MALLYGVYVAVTEAFAVSSWVMYVVRVTTLIGVSFGMYLGSVFTSSTKFLK